MAKKPQPGDSKDPKHEAFETAEEIYRKEIRPHEGGSIGPSPEGNVHDSHIPPPRRG